MEKILVKVHILWYSIIVKKHAYELPDGADTLAVFGILKCAEGLKNHGGMYNERNFNETVT